MKLVIEIDEQDRETIMTTCMIPERLNVRIAGAINNGTPIKPKDAQAKTDELLSWYNRGYNDGIQTGTYTFRGLGRYV